MDFSLWKAFGVFASIIVVIFFVGSTLINVSKEVADGNIKGALGVIGSKFAFLDDNLKEEAEWIRTSSIDDKMFFYHLGYGFSILFMLFMVFIILYKVLAFFGGKYDWNGFTIILIVLSIFAVVGLVLFLYKAIFLDRLEIPLSGVYSFVKVLFEKFLAPFSS